MLCAPLDWQYAELPLSASDAVLCTVLVCKRWVIYSKLPIKRPGRLFKNRSFRVGAYSDRALIWTRVLIKKMKSKVIIQQSFSLCKVQRLDSLHRFLLAVLHGNTLRPYVYAVMQ